MNQFRKGALAASISLAVAAGLAYAQTSPSGPSTERDATGASSTMGSTGSTTGTTGSMTTERSSATSPTTSPSGTSSASSTTADMSRDAGTDSTTGRRMRIARADRG